MTVFNIDNEKLLKMFTISLCIFEQIHADLETIKRFISKTFKNLTNPKPIIGRVSKTALDHRCECS